MYIYAHIYEDSQFESATHRVSMTHLRVMRVTSKLIYLHSSWLTKGSSSFTNTWAYESHSRGVYVCRTEILTLASSYSLKITCRHVVFFPCQSFLLMKTRCRLQEGHQWSSKCELSCHVFLVTQATKSTDILMSCTHKYGEVLRTWIYSRLAF